MRSVLAMAPQLSCSRFLILLLVPLIPGVAHPAPQTFNTALPVASEEIVFREQFMYKSVNDDPTGLDRDVDVFGAVTVLGYGITSDLTLFGVLPYLDKELDVTPTGGDRLTRKTSGFADARLFGRYTLIQKDASGRSFRVASFAGIELPTGDDDDSDRRGRLPPAFQLGSGSWDPFFGVVATWQTLDYQVDAQASYKANTEANDFTFGDEVRLDASFQYRLWPQKLDEGVPGFLYTGLEANFLYQDKNEIDGSEDPNSGGKSFFLSPSVQYVTRRWILEAVVQIPVNQDLNGNAVEDDVTVRAGFRINF